MAADPQMSDEARTAVALLNRLADELRKRHGVVRQQLDYYKGRHKLCYASPEFQDYFAGRFNGFADNWTAPVAAAPAERMNVLGIRLDPDARTADRELAEAWRVSDCERGSSEAFVVTLAAARSYCLVWGNNEDEPRVTWERPDQAIVGYDGDTGQRTAALKLWADDTLEYATLYTSGGVWKFSRPRSASTGYSVTGLIVPSGDAVRGAGPYGWQPRQGPSDDAWPIPNPMGVVPMVELRNQTLLDDDPVSDISGVMAMQDAINLTWAYLMNALDFASLPQRVVMGADVPKMPILDSSGQKVGERPIELDALINERILWLTGDARIGNWPAADLSAYSNVIERAIEHIAAQTRTPPHYLIGRVANLPLALDTVVPIPGGRTTMGELSVGDEVFAVDGSVQKVVGVSPVFYDHDCYRLTFDDGTEVVADAAHKWQTTRFVDPANPYGSATSVVTTKDIAESLRTSMGTYNHYIPVAKPHDGQESAFLVDPYVLGVFLGGDGVNGVVADDVEEVAGYLRDCGERVRIDPYSRKIVFCRARMKALGVWKNKHVPEAYFHGSFKQRLALLQGIMDTYGTLNRKQGSVAITLHDERLARDVHRLIQSLGHKAALRRREWRNEPGSGVCWRMTWAAVDPVFRLTRKLLLQRTDFGGDDGKSTSPFRRYIVSCEPVASVPVRCINVSSKAHLFCVTDAFIATHNSAEALTAAETGLVSKTGERIVYVNPSVREIHALMALAMGSDAKAKACRRGTVMWADTQFRALGQKVDALMKLKGMGFPLAWIAEQYGLEPPEVERVMRMVDDEAARNPVSQMLNGPTEPQIPAEGGEEPADAGSEFASVGG